MKTYRGYGLTFASDLALPGFAESAGPCDVTIRVTPEAGDAAEAAGITPMIFSRHADSGFLLRIPEAADYWVRNPQEILITPMPEADEGHIRLYLTGSAIGLILHLRGIQTLHAATIAIDGTAIAFVGDQGAGKSTLAATMALAHQVLGDDVIALEHREDAILAHPGGAEFKLWQDTLDHLGLAKGSSIANRSEKFFTPSPGVHLAEPMPLGAVVVLARGGEAIQAERFALLDATDQIMQHGYRPHYVPMLDRQAENFEHCARTAARLPVWRLTRPEGLEHLAATRAWLEAHWQELIQPGD